MRGHGRTLAWLKEGIWDYSSGSGVKGPGVDPSRSSDGDEGVVGLEVTGDLRSVFDEEIIWKSASNASYEL